MIALVLADLLVCGFSALRAEKPHTIENKVPLLLLVGIVRLAERMLPTNEGKLILIEKKRAWML